VLFSFGNRALRPKWKVVKQTLLSKHGSEGAGSEPTYPWRRSRPWSERRRKKTVFFSLKCNSEAMNTNKANRYFCSFYFFSMLRVPLQNPAAVAAVGSTKMLRSNKTAERSATAAVSVAGRLVCLPFRCKGMLATACPKVKMQIYLRKVSKIFVRRKKRSCV
jgi:hypothetical protein